MFYFITADTMTNIDVFFFLFQISSDKENKHDDQGTGDMYGRERGPDVNNH